MQEMDGCGLFSFWILLFLRLLRSKHSLCCTSLLVDGYGIDGFSIKFLLLIHILLQVNRIKSTQLVDAAFPHFHDRKHCINKTNQNLR
ncbi:hypothetical protein FPV67DRAFT_925438 [Lyophyllum atratum]|nr:hypothetical protein FPV67DRAFT_925438 [Lyophyllum atratum]